ncbi:MAG: lipid-A-disaccharide synthase [bacterium]|nr:lipid-A-disaccharide synthase [bacterium]
MNILISAAEISGDMHAAKLVEEIKKLDSRVCFSGIGGNKLKEQGVDIIDDITSCSTIGFIEPLLYIPRILAAYFRIKKLLVNQRPDLLITVDAQGFNIPLLAKAKEAGIPSIYYIAPQEWHWGTVKGGKKVIARTDRILSIFKEEADFYNKSGGNAVFVGHPVLDIAKSNVSKDKLCKDLNISKDKKIISIFPGSRSQEIKYVAPVLLESAAAIQTEEDVSIVISIVSAEYEKALRKLAKEKGIINPVFYQGNSYDLIANTYLSLVTSGTVTLEHAVMGTPCLAGYRLSELSYRTGRLILGERIKKIKYIALPNILMDEMILPEFIQDQLSSDKIVSKALSLIKSKSQYDRFRGSIKKIRSKIGEPGVIKRAAREVVSYIHNNKGCDQ